jgi:hypothetical protein
MLPIVVPAYVSFLFLVLLLAHFPFGIPFVEDIQCGFRGITERAAHSKHTRPAVHRTHAPFHEEQTHDDTQPRHHEGEYPPEIKTIKPRTEHVYHLLSDYTDGRRAEKDTGLLGSSQDLLLVLRLLHHVKPSDMPLARVIRVKSGLHKRNCYYSIGYDPSTFWGRLACLVLKSYLRREKRYEKDCYLERAFNRQRRRKDHDRMSENPVSLLRDPGLRRYIE